jgi:2'-deoxynucleoside 5'-phosphate N-hydrolase
MKESLMILGSLPNNRTEEKLYESMVGICSKYAKIVFSPVDTVKFKGTDYQRYERALQKVKDADLIIGEQTKPSTGQGIEIGYAITLKKQLLVVAKQGSKVSGLIKGCPAVRDILYYNSVEDLETKLSKFLENYS